MEAVPDVVEHIDVKAYKKYTEQCDVAYLFAPCMLFGLEEKGSQHSCNNTAVNVG